MNDILQLLLSAGGAGILAALINAVMNRRKLSAEATEIITKAAAGTVENIMKDNSHLRERIVLLEAQLLKLQGIIELSEQRERIHQTNEERFRWHTEQWHNHCSKMSERLKRLGEDVGPPPPLWPEGVNFAKRIAADPNIEEI